MTKIKICGLTSIDDAQILNELHVDYAGIVMFFPKSKRSISPDDASKIINSLDKKIKKTAVVVSPTAKQLSIIENCGFDIIQIHGDIDKALLDSVRLPVFKAFNVNDTDTIGKYSGCNNIIGYVFDAAGPGSGKTFDWSMINTIDTGNKLRILAGGLNDQNVKAAIKYVNPDIVDVSSGVENDNGYGKSREKARLFVNQVRESVS